MGKANALQTARDCGRYAEICELLGVRRQLGPVPDRNPRWLTWPLGCLWATCPPPLWIRQGTMPSKDIATRGKRRRRGAWGTRHPGSR